MRTSPAPTPEAALLAVETSGEVCSVAVLRGQALMAEHRFRHGMHLSEHLMGHIDAVLHESGATLAETRAFAVGLGPGSFTGTRIAVMTMKTLAFVTGQPIFGVSGLEALAAEFTGLRETLVAPLLPSRTGVVFAGLYAVEEETPRALTPPDALPLEALIATLAAQETKRVLFCGPATRRYGAQLRQALEEMGTVVSIHPSDDPRASRIARLAALRFAAASPDDDPLTLVPLYIAPPQITLPKQPFPTAGEEVAGSE